MRNTLYMSAAYTLIAVGAITIIISFLGCMGSLSENRILLLTYFVFVLLLFVVLLIGGVLAYVFRHQILGYLIFIPTQQRRKTRSKSLIFCSIFVK